MNRVREFWDQLGGKLGILLCLGGFVAMFLGWNGAASYDRVPAQFPYLVSGGLVGLSLVIIGAAMILVETGRKGRDEVIAALAELRAAMETGVGGVQTAVLSGGAVDGTVVAGASSFHRPDCRLVQGRDDAHLMTVQEAEDDGLSACRICNPVAA
jgi:hypothetical protein